MIRCHDLERLLTPYLDGEAAPVERADVDAHLAACSACRRRAGAEASARQVLKARANALAVQAPLGLRTRCAALAAEPERRRFWALPRWATKVATAVLVLTVAAVGFEAVASRSATVLASELALDHLKCFGLFEGTSGPPDARVLQARLRERYGWEMNVPGDLESDDLRVIGARRCVYHHGGIAHVMYRYHGEPVSLFMLPDTSQPAYDLSVLGHETRFWSVGNTTYAVVMRADAAAVSRVALRLRQLVGLVDGR